MVITAEMVEPLVTGVTSTVTNLVPVGIGLMALFVGISALKRVIYTFL